MAASAEAAVVGSPAPVFRLPFRQYSEQEVHDLARASPGGLFVDTEFPDDDTSLFLDPDGPAQAMSKVASWRRPGEISSEPSLFHNGSCDSDIIQGALGDCWFLAALCVMASRWDLMRELFVSCHPEHGFYQIRFWKEEQWVVVTIDDRIPCDYTGQPVYARCRDPREMWVPLVEKAYAKLHGCYEALKGGSVPYALSDLTVGESENVDFAGLARAGLLWDRLSLFMDEEWLVGTSMVVEGDTEDLTTQGLLNKHAYGVLKVAEVDGEKLVQLRNPWGKTEWTGKWSDLDPVWSTGLAAKLNYQIGDDGLFWMGLEDFTAHFNRLYVCRLYLDGFGDKWHRTAVVGEWRGVTAGGCVNYATWVNNPQYTFQPTEEKTHFFASLAQNDGKLTRRPTTHIGLLVLRVDEVNARKVKVAPEDLVASCSYANSREVTVCADLEAGQSYVIVPSTFQPGYEGTYVMSIYTNKPCPINFISSAGDVQVIEELDIDFTIPGSGLSGLQHQGNLTLCVSARHIRKSSGKPSREIVHRPKPSARKRRHPYRRNQRLDASTFIILAASLLRSWWHTSNPSAVNNQ